MLGLGVYDSSSEDEAQTQPTPKLEKQQPKKVIAQQNAVPAPAPAPAPTPLNDTALGPSTSTAPSGPVLGPESMEDPSPNGRSPFSASRALIQDLTLPSVPNLDIPPSPPGSPNPAANAKFEHFLSLKKQGVHFNAKLASSSSLKNPSLLQKMMQHAGIEEQGQYETSLPTELWDISSIPQWGHKEELLRAQQEFRSKLESEPRSSIQFVSGSEAKPKNNA